MDVPSDRTVSLSTTFYMIEKDVKTLFFRNKLTYLINCQLKLFNSKGHEVCGHVGNGIPCKRIGKCPFHHEVMKKQKENPDYINNFRNKLSPSVTLITTDKIGKIVQYKTNWTKEEHLRFLEGLKTFGPGNWKAIKKVVGSRTMTQVHSHAQKYMKRQMQKVKIKKSLLDMTLEDLRRDLRNDEKENPSSTTSIVKNENPWLINHNSNFQINNPTLGNNNQLYNNYLYPNPNVHSQRIIFPNQIPNTTTPVGNDNNGNQNRQYYIPIIQYVPVHTPVGSFLEEEDGNNRNYVSVGLEKQTMNSNNKLNIFQQSSFPPHNRFHPRKSEKKPIDEIPSQSQVGDNEMENYNDEDLSSSSSDEEITGKKRKREEDIVIDDDDDDFFGSLNYPNKKPKLDEY